MNDYNLVAECNYDGNREATNSRIIGLSTGNNWYWRSAICLPADTS